MLTLRTALGLTQSKLAEILGISRRSIGEWEAGSSYPKAKHLQQLIEIGVQQQTFPAGREAQEIHLLWKAAHQKVLLDEQWLADLLKPSYADNGEVPALSLQPPPIEEPSQETSAISVENASAPTASTIRPCPSPAQPPPLTGPRIDWGDALTVSAFYGREQELAQLVQWTVQERCRTISLLGMGGIGKSALSVKLMHQVAEHFEVVLFRSLRDAPSCEALLDDCLQAISPQPINPMPTTLERRISLLLELLRHVRTLLVLDNLEGLLDEGNIKGRFRHGFEGYGLLLRRVAETPHQSCLLLTSREKPAELRALEGKQSPVHSLRLPGLELPACQQIFAEKDANGTPQEQEQLAQLYAGNPLALKIIAETVIDLFAGKIGLFLTTGTVIFGSIAHLLAEQFTRLSPLEQSILRWLAIAREPVTIDDLLAMLMTPLPRVQALEAIDSLRRRSLIERGQQQASFTLQAVVLEYVTARLIEEASTEIQEQHLERLIEYGLVQAQAKEYVRQTQQRLIVGPILSQLHTIYSHRGGLEKRLIALLDQVRAWEEYTQGYGPANLIALLRELRGDLRHLDLSHLSIRGAYLQGVEMQDTSLVQATLQDTVFTETFDAIWSVAISSHGQYWAAGSQKGEVHVWREEGRLLHLVWLAHTDNACALAFSPDELTLATASWDGTVKLWDLEQGTLLWTGQHRDIIRKMAFSPTGHLLATGSDDGMIQLWNPASGAIIQEVADESGAIYGMNWSPDGRLLATSRFDGCIRLWQFQGTQLGSCVKILSGHTNWICGLAFSPDGTSLVSGCWDKTVKLWDVVSGRLLHTLTGHTDRVQAIAWSPDGRTIASAGFDNVIWLWDVEHCIYRARLQGHTDTIYNIAFTPDSKRLISGGEDGSLGVWDVEHGQCVHIMQGQAVTLYSVAWHPSGTHLATGGSDGLALVWDAINGTQPRAFGGHKWGVLGVSWSPDGRLLASIGRDNLIQLWDPETGTRLQVLCDPDHEDTVFYGGMWSPDGHLLASGSYMRGVHVWHVETGQHCWVGSTHQTRIRSVAWSPDSSRLASAGYDGSICLWRACDGALLERWQRHQGTALCVAWSPDGRWLASGGSNREGRELFVWDADSGQILRSFPGKPGSVFAIAWSKDGKRLVSGRNDGIIRWWDVNTWKLLQIRQTHQHTIHAVQVSPDGRLVASCGVDSTIKLWGMESTELVRTLRRDRPYERLNITGIQGLTAEQKTTLRALGAYDEV
jgi:WD40 repeat protein/transcriptional regulator with XRE-family HTH domain